MKVQVEKFRLNGHIIGFCPQTQKLELHTKQIHAVPCKSTGREVSFEWSLHRISSTDSKVRTTLLNSIIHSGIERVKQCCFGVRIHWFRVDGRLIRVKKSIKNIRIYMDLVLLSKTTTLQV